MHGGIVDQILYSVFDMKINLSMIAYTSNFLKVEHINYRIRKSRTYPCLLSVRHCPFLSHSQHEWKYQLLPGNKPNAYNNVWLSFIMILKCYSSLSPKKVSNVYNTWFSLAEVSRKIAFISLANAFPSSTDTLLSLCKSLLLPTSTMGTLKWD